LNPYAVDAAYVCCGHVYIYRFGTTYSTRDKSYVRRHPFPCIALNFGFNVQIRSHHRFMFRSLLNAQTTPGAAKAPMKSAKRPEAPSRIVREGASGQKVTGAGL